MPTGQSTLPAKRSWTLRGANLLAECSDQSSSKNYCSSAFRQVARVNAPDHVLRFSLVGTGDYTRYSDLLQEFGSGDSKMTLREWLFPTDKLLCVGNRMILIFPPFFQAPPPLARRFPGEYAKANSMPLRTRHFTNLTQKIYSR